jgi:hypothetical protein
VNYVVERCVGVSHAKCGVVPVVKNTAVVCVAKGEDMKRNHIEVQLLDDITRIVGAMFKDRIILHCDSCDHEADAVLGEKCSWCGGKMVEIK